MILSDGFLANSSEPWRIPDPADIPPIPWSCTPTARQRPGQRRRPFLPYLRDAETLARPWAIPGTAGLEHRIGGLSKAPVTGNVSYNQPCTTNAWCASGPTRSPGWPRSLPPQEVFGPAAGTCCCSVGAARLARCARPWPPQRHGRSVAHAHLRYLNPFPRNLRDVLSRYRQVVVPELNGGQLAFLLRGRYALNIQSFPKVHGRPFTISEITDKIEQLLG
jgi:2-oxoglutarate ferredoxin oxidoreductase subunit alpha